MNWYPNALVTVGVAALAITIGYLLFGRKQRGTVQVDERTHHTWRRLTEWMLPAYLGLSYVLCLVLVADHRHQVSVFAIMTYLWVTMIVFGIAFSVVRRR